MSPSIKPLQGLRVLDVSNFMAGPFCATPGGIESLGPELGNHNQEIYLKLLGMTEAEFARYQETKII